ncbi:MAG: polysaccharide deacetylase family protein [Candidatus Auribacterota bacterium]|nr:polysaccharide deacetylase family protein [Candidatus Auribacterota bacterium]
MNVGLRIDVDTYNGTRTGVPTLLDILSQYKIRATFFFSVGPDNMGRHLWRLLRPKFLLKMLRSKAGSLYGWDILLRGTFWPGPDISRVLKSPLEEAFAAGHEIGLHSIDHHRWQKIAGAMDREDIIGELSAGFQVISNYIGKDPISFAAPSWKGTDNLLRVEMEVGLQYGSDCRGSNIFRPIVEGDLSSIPQIPVTLPTYDEVIGWNNVSDRNYNDYLLSLITEDRLNVLTIHAEVEGMSKSRLFKEFLDRALDSGITFLPLGSLLPDDLSSIPTGVMEKGSIPGREGWVAEQREDKTQKVF